MTDPYDGDLPFDSTVAHPARVYDYWLGGKTTLDGDDPWRLVADLMAAAAPGSYLAITHPASDVAPEASARASQAYNDNVATPQTRRSREEVARFFTGLELVDPGLVQLSDWRPAAGDVRAPTSGYGAVARKP